MENFNPFAFVEAIEKQQSESLETRCKTEPEESQPAISSRSLSEPAHIAAKTKNEDAIPCDVLYVYPSTTDSDPNQPTSSSSDSEPEIYNNLAPFSPPSGFSDGGSPVKKNNSVSPLNNSFANCTISSSESEATKTASENHESMEADGEPEICIQDLEMSDEDSEEYSPYGHRLSDLKQLCDEELRDIAEFCGLPLSERPSHFEFIQSIMTGGEYDKRPVRLSRENVLKRFYAAGQLDPEKLNPCLLQACQNRVINISGNASLSAVIYKGSCMKCLASTARSRKDQFSTEQGAPQRKPKISPLGLSRMIFEQGGADLVGSEDEGECQLLNETEIDKSKFEIKVTVEDLLLHPSWVGAYGSYGSTSRLKCGECRTVYYLVGLCLGYPELTADPKRLNYCTDCRSHPKNEKLRYSFGVCTYNSNVGHCRRCDAHYNKGPVDNFNCPCWDLE